MNFKIFATSACMLLASATPSLSVPVNLDFSFGGQSGTVFGLDNSDGISSATGFNFSGNFDLYEIDASQLNLNEFIFSSGVLSSVLLSLDSVVEGTSQLFELANFDLNSDFGAARERTVALPLAFPTSGPATFSQSPVSAVPLPVSGLLLLSGLAGLLALRRRKIHGA